MAVISTHPPPASIPWLVLLWCLWLFVQNWSDVCLAFDITCIISVLGIPQLTSPHSLHLSFFCLSLFRLQRPQREPDPGHSQKSFQRNHKRQKPVSIFLYPQPTCIMSSFFFLLTGSDCYTLFLGSTTVDVAQVCMNSNYFHHNQFFCLKNSSKVKLFFFKPGDEKCNKCFQGAE